MTRKEKIDLILSKVSEDQKEALVAELREAKDRKERTGVLEKFNVVLTKEEIEAFKAEGVSEISDAELDQAAGGCCQQSCKCSYGCGG